MRSITKKKSKNRNGLVAHLTLEKDGINFLGQSRIALLEEIHKTGSISQAAKKVGISYKGAWDTIDSLNNLSDQPLVERSVGGKKGGGTIVTDYGLKLIETFHEIENDYQKGLSGAKIVPQHFSKTKSAHNQFIGEVIKIIKGTANSEIQLKVDEDFKITSILPNTSLLSLTLRKGSLAKVFFQSSSVILSTSTEMKISARNQFLGTIERIKKGAVTSEIFLDAGNRKTICSIISNISVKEMKLTRGMKVIALIKASNILFGVNS